MNILLIEILHEKKGFILYAAIDGKAVLFEDSFGLCNSCCGDS